MFVLAACDSDSTPIVPMAAAGGGSPGDSNKLGPNDRLQNSQSSDNQLSLASTLSMAMASLPSP